MSPLDLLKRPMVAAILAGIVGLVLGLTFAWLVWPLKYTDVTPDALRADYQEDYLRMAIDSYRINPDPETAWGRIQSLGTQNAFQLLDKIQNEPAKQDMATIMNFRTAVTARFNQSQAQNPIEPTNTNTAEAAGTPSIFSNKIVIGGFGILALLIIVGAVYMLWNRFGVKTSPENYSAARQAAEITKTTEKTDFTKMGLQEPTSRTMTTYVLGDDLYDESFSIDAQSGEFLGEYGVGVSEAIGVGDPKKVTAVEIWLFDKNDIKTATKVLMSQHAFNDPNVRNKLEAKGELVMIEPQGQVLLETATLQLLATVVDLEYGQSNLPEKSYFDRITLELAVWPKA